MKKTLGIFMSLLMAILSVVPCFASDAGGDFAYELLNDGTVKITQYFSQKSSVTVPGTISGKKVSAIADDVFAFHDEIQSVVIENGIETIGKRAFNDCINIKKLTLPSSVTKIDESAFYSCTRLEDFAFPESLEIIGSGAFYGCNSLEKVVIPKKVKQVGDYAFSACLNLKDVTIENGLEKISNQMFFECHALESVSLPSSIKEIGRKAFLSCENLTEVSMPQTLNLVDEEAFSGCFNLSMPCPSATKIGDLAFSGVNFESIDLKQNVEYIGNGAFSGGSATSVYIPDSVTHLEPDSFLLACNEEFVISQNNAEYKSEDGVIFSKDMKTLICVPRSKGEEDDTYTVPSSVKTIGDMAFSENQFLKKVVLPNGLESIGKEAFKDCSSLEEIILPQSLTKIGEGAFSSCMALESFAVPKAVKKIENDTFSDCYNLKEIKLSEGVEEIGENAFSSCSELKEFVIPASTKSLTYSAFNLCDGVELKFAPNGNFVFENDMLMTKNKTTLIAYLGSESRFVVPEGIKEISSHAITCEKISTVVIPSSVEKLDEMSVGYMISFGEDPYVVGNNFRIYAANCAAAASYAKENNIAFYTAEPKPNATKITLKSGEDFNFEISGTQKQNLEFASSDTKIVSVDQQGKVTANCNGVAEVFAVCGNDKFKLLVTVENGSDPQEIYSAYHAVSDSEVDSWSSSYFSYNNTQRPQINDLYSANIYTSQYYIPIMAHLVGGDYEKDAKGTYGEDYGQFKQAADNLPHELSKYKLHENTVFFSGTNDVDYITHASSSISDMISSIGTTHTFKGVISTSVSHGVAAGFSLGANHTVLDFYIDKDTSYGAYIADVSHHDYELEYLLTRDLTYKVLDAGMRTATVTNPYSGEPEQIVERFMKLKIEGKSSEPSDEKNDFLEMLLKILSAIAAIVMIILKFVETVV